MTTTAVVVFTEQKSNNTVAMIITFHSQLIQLLSYLEKDETDYNIDCDSPTETTGKMRESRPLTDQE